MRMLSGSENIGGQEDSSSGGAGSGHDDTLHANNLNMLYNTDTEWIAIVFRLFCIAPRIYDHRGAVGWKYPLN